MFLLFICIIFRYLFLDHCWIKWNTLFLPCLLTWLISVLWGAHFSIWLTYTLFKLHPSAFWKGLILLYPCDVLRSCGVEIILKGWLLLMWNFILTGLAGVFLCIGCIVETGHFPSCRWKPLLLWHVGVWYFDAQGTGWGESHGYALYVAQSPLPWSQRFSRCRWENLWDQGKSPLTGSSNLSFHFV